MGRYSALVAGASIGGHFRRAPWSYLATAPLPAAWVSVYLAGMVGQRPAVINYGSSAPAALRPCAIPTLGEWALKPSPRLAALAAAGTRLANASPVRANTGWEGSSPPDWLSRRARAVIEVTATVASSGWFLLFRVVENFLDRSLNHEASPYLMFWPITCARRVASLTSV